ncbi:MAG: alkaline phosphatase D family protein [Deltaproteobacteria bacterium]|nr:alkaline phosphatase D family protein [Deltaproteobacteria bacterium]
MARDLDRREWLLATSALGAGAIAFAVGGGGCDHAGGTRDAAAAVLEPSHEALIVAVWARRARAATVAVRAGDAPAVLRELAFGASGSAAVDIGGLAPGAGYEIVVTLDDGTSLAPLRGRLAPDPADARPVRLAVVADIDPNPDFDTDICAHLLAAEPDLLVGLGDFPYTDNGPIAETLEVYRERHAAIRVHPPIRALLDAMPLRAIYDDHEFRNNWDAMFVAAEPARYAAAVAVWDEFFPVRAPAGEVRYRSWRHGAHVECFLLDCRRFRSANAAADGPGKTMLGDAQRAWFLDALARSTATWKLVFTSVPLDFGNGVDHWRGFLSERDALFDAIVAAPITGIAFFSADQHWFASHRHTFGIREFMSGPLARGIATPDATPPGVLFHAERFNALLVDASPDALVVTGLGEGGERFFEERLTVADLTPART